MNAIAIPTLEFAIGTSDVAILFVGRCLTFDEFVVAVVFFVASPRQRDTSAIATSECVGWTCRSNFAARQIQTLFLVRIVPAIVGSIANPFGQDASGSIGAVFQQQALAKRNLSVHRLGVLTIRLGTSHLVTGIRTIGFIVASERAVDARTALAFKHGGLRTRTSDLVTVVTAVVFVIARRIGENAAIIGALEVVGLAFTNSAIPSRLVRTVRAILNTVARQIVRNANRILAMRYRALEFVVAFAF